MTKLFILALTIVAFTSTSVMAYVVSMNDSQTFEGKKSKKKTAPADDDVVFIDPTGGF